MKNSNFLRAVTLLMRGELRELAERILNKLSHSSLSAVVYYDRFFVLGYGDRSPAVASRLRSIVIRQATPADIPALERLTGRGDVYAQRFQRGDTAVVALNGAVIVGMKWVRFVEQHLEDINGCLMVLPEQSAWSLDAFVAPRYRFTGLWLNLTEAVTRIAAARSVRRIFCSVNALNRPSLQTHRRYGSRVCGEVLCLRLMALRIYVTWVFTAAAQRKFQGLRCCWGKAAAARITFDSMRSLETLAGMYAYDKKN